MRVGTGEDLDQNLNKKYRKGGDDKPLHTRRDVKVEANPVVLYAGARTHHRSVRRRGAGVKAVC